MDPVFLTQPFSGSHKVILYRIHTSYEASNSGIPNSLLQPRSQTHVVYTADGIVVELLHFLRLQTAVHMKAQLFSCNALNLLAKRGGAPFLLNCGFLQRGLLASDGCDQSQPVVPTFRSAFTKWVPNAIVDAKSEAETLSCQLLGTQVP